MSDTREQILKEFNVSARDRGLIYSSMLLWHRLGNHITNSERDSLRTAWDRAKMDELDFLCARIADRWTNESD